MVKVNKSYLAEAFPDAELKTISKLDLSKRDIHKVAGLEVCTSLVRLDLSHNRLTSLEGVAPCHTLKWFSAAANQISSIACLKGLKDLQVLNLSSNALAGSVDVSFLTSLGALILNSNQITGVTGLDQLPQLNTIVLKESAIQDLGDSLLHCSQLLKLSLSHNSIRDLGACLTACTSLAELRLGHNKLCALPAELSQNAALRILDLGSNLIAKYAAIKVLKELPLLVNLTLKGCPIAEKADYQERLLSILPGLEILDGHRVRNHVYKPKKQAAQPAAAFGVGTEAGARHPAKRSAEAPTVAAGTAGKAATKEAPGNPAKRRKGMLDAVTVEEQADHQIDDSKAKQKKRQADIQATAAAAERVRQVDTSRSKHPTAVPSVAKQPSEAAPPEHTGKKAKKAKRAKQRAAAADPLQSEAALGSAEPLAVRLAATAGNASATGEAELNGKPRESGKAGKRGSAAASIAEPAEQADPAHFSGVVGVYEALGDPTADKPSGKAKAKKKQKQAAADQAGPIRGASVAHVLTAPAGLAPLEVGLGTGSGWSSWDAPAAVEAGAAPLQPADREASQAKKK